ncbi:ABC transporter permease [Sulfidibacter corallicola]|uniref:ABC transporter permease n=1 Tax=Sulfidibacter corallicola TaxID=2818388 RepID=A0A8A4TT40_SULCO|nr:ABC transporter permease subunit [Sulfidibacter corallicola]QTD52248.1 ABC transporter permease [Sulfidibacter corallicola]
MQTLETTASPEREHMDRPSQPAPRKARLGTGPQPNLNQVRLTWTLARLTAKRLIRRKLFWFLSLLSLLPCLVVFYWIIDRFAANWSSPEMPFAMFRNIQAVYFHIFFMPLLSVFMGLGVISEEIESKNITFTLVRPLNRASIAVGRLLGHLLAASLLLSVAVFCNFMSNMVFQVEELIPTLPNLINGILILCAGLAGYMSVVAMLGTFWKKFAILGSIIFLLMDTAFSLIPVATLNFISVRFRMMAAYWEPLPRFLPSLIDIPRGSFVLNIALIFVLFVAIPLGVMAFRLSQFEIVLGGGEAG